MNLAYNSSSVQSTNRDLVFRNTFGLVGLSMIPTCIAAWLVSLIPMSFYLEHPILTIALFIGNFIISIALMLLASRSRSASTGIIGFFLFATSMGAGIGPVISQYLHLHNGLNIILQAASATGIALFGITAYAQHTKRDFSFMGGFLTGSLLVVILMSFVGMFFHSSIFTLILSSLSAILFMGYILYDVSRIVTGGETNYIFAAIGIYLDVLNLFLSLLRIFGFLSSDD
jgi:modulator of FtsH protease